MKRIYASAICILIPVILQAKPALEIVLNSSQTTNPFRGGL